MEKSNLSYMKFTAISGIIAYPIFTYKAIKRLIKNEKIKDSVEFIIEKAKETAKLPPKEELTPVKMQLLRDSYNEKDDFFSFHFKSETIRNLSFEEKIEYCLEKYKEESKTIFTATNLLVLEENFLKGASRTLTLYFFFENYGIDIGSQKQDEPTILMQINQTVLNNEYRSIKNEVTNNYNQNIDKSVTNNYNQNIDKSVTNNNRNIYCEIEKEKDVDFNVNAQNSISEIKDFRSLFLKECDYETVYNFFKANGLLPEKDKFRRGSKRAFAYVLLDLQEKGIIRQLEANQLSTVISNSFTDGISTSTISNVKTEGSNNMNSSILYLLNLLYKELEVEC